MDIKTHIAHLFKEKYGISPSNPARPQRSVNLLGEHVDYMTTGMSCRLWMNGSGFGKCPVNLDTKEKAGYFTNTQAAKYSSATELYLEIYTCWV